MQQTQKLNPTSEEMREIISFQSQVTKVRTRLLVQWQEESAKCPPNKERLVQLYAELSAEARRLTQLLETSRQRPEVVEVLRECIEQKIHRFVLRHWDTELRSLSPPAPRTVQSHPFALG